MPKSQRLPALRQHKPSGRAVVTLNGVDHYCGKWGSVEAKAEYDRLIAEWLSNGRSLRRASGGVPDLTISELVAKYWEFAQAHYQIDGKPTAEPGKIREALRPVVRLYGHAPARDFGPVAFKTVRAEFIKADLCRTTIGHHLSKVRRFIKWAVEHELVPADAYERIRAVAPLRPGRDGVREPSRVRPVSDEAVEAVLPHVSPPVRAMIELQRLTGMRPGEVIRMTSGQIDQSESTWVYRPGRHKTALLGRNREIPLGPRAQELLAAWMKPDPKAPLFSPAEEFEARMAERRKNRKTPRTPSSRARKRKKAPRRAPREIFDKDTYGRAIRRACEKAGIEAWSPNQLRHSLATRVRKRYGLEAVQVMLGHAKADVSQVYAERDNELARRIAREIG
jgi:integrase